MTRKNASVRVSRRALTVDQYYVVAVPLFPKQPCTVWAIRVRFRWKSSRSRMASTLEKTTSKGSRTSMVVQTMNESEGGGT